MYLKCTLDTFFLKQHVAIKICVTDMGKSVSISFETVRKLERIYRFTIFYCLLTRF